LGAAVARLDFRVGFRWHWKDPQEHIGIKEARALSCGQQRVMLRSGAGVGFRHLYLVDNLGDVAAFVRGRCRNPVVNSLIQRHAAMLLATASTADYIWVPTRFQPADRGSRQ
jgi:hypothetical protein